MKPVLSIIIATFNAAATLRRCLDSVLMQKDQQSELLVIDGGSTDGTQAILTGYGSQIDLVLSERDRGIYDAWNKGIVRSRGQWIMFIGADDILEPDALASYLAFIQGHDTTGIDYISSQHAYLGRQGELLKVFGSPWRWQEFRRKMLVAHVGSLHSRALFDEVGLYDLRFTICGDYELLLRKRGELRCLYLAQSTARMAMGGASYSMRALRETHQIQKLHSGLSPLTLKVIHFWQILLFWRHRLLHP